MSSPLEIRTILRLMVDGHMEVDTGLKLIAESCDVPTDTLTAALRGMPSNVSVTIDTTPTAEPKAKPKAKAGGGKRNSFTPWTPQDEARAVNMYNEGHTLSTIARVLKRTRNAVGHKLYVLKLSGAPIVPRPYTPKGFMLTHRGGKPIKK